MLKKSMDLSDQKKKLIFRSWHRGTREMDLIMGTFAEAYVPSFTDAELAAYEEVLLENDPDVYDWYIGAKPVPANRMNSVLEKLLAFKVPSAA